MFELKNRLYGPRVDLKKWSGYRVGMNGPAGVVSLVNNSTTQTARVSNVAVTIEDLMDQKVSVCPVIDQNLTYVEMPDDEGTTMIPCIVNVDIPGRTFTVLYTGISVSRICGAVHAIFCSILYNDKLSQSLKNAGYNVDLIRNEMSNLASVTVDQMLVCCDSFYHTVGKVFKVDEIINDQLFQSSKQRLEQNSICEHNNPTADPVGITVVQTQSDDSSQDVLFAEPLNDFMQRCRNGEFVIDFAWNDFQKQSIKPLSFLNTYVPTEEFRELLLSIWFQLSEVLKKMRSFNHKGVDPASFYDDLMDEPINVQIMGKPGSGKTKMVEAILCALGYPKGIINCKGRSEEDEMEGLNKIVQGRVTPIPTKMTEFFSIGGGILLEEINLPDPDILQGAIGQALVYPYIMKVDGYQEIKRHPLTIIFGTLNVGTNGTKPMNEGLASRLSEGCILEDVDDEAFKQIICATGYPKKHCNTAFRAYKAALEYLESNGNEEYCLSITIRGCKKAAQKLAMGFSKKQVIRSAFVTQIYSRDMPVALELEEYLNRVV